MTPVVTPGRRRKRSQTEFSVARIARASTIRPAGLGGGEDGSDSGPSGLAGSSRQGRSIRGRKESFSVSTLTKVFIVLTTVLSIALSSLFIAAAAQWANYKVLADSFQQQRDALLMEKQQISASAEAALALKDEALATRAGDLAAAQAKLAEFTKRLADMSSEFAQVKNERLAFEAGRTKLQEILDVTTGELKSLQKQNQALLSSNIDLQSRNSRLNGRVLELTTNVQILTNNVRNIQEKLYACEQGRPTGLSIGAAAPTPIPGAALVAPATGGVLRGAIKEATGEYASIDIGESAGVAAGMTFMIYREGAGYVGDIVIERVRPGESGGKVTTTLSDIRRGDQVVLAPQG